MPKAMHPLRRNVQSASSRPLLECFSNRRRFKHARRRHTSREDFAKIRVIPLEAASEPPHSELRPASTQVFQQSRGDFVSEVTSRFFVSDLFDNVSGTFDLIIFDPPFRWFRPRSIEDRATADEDYTTLTTFFKNVRSVLRPGGRILLFFGTSGDIAYLRHLITNARLRKRIVASKEITKDGWKVKYFTYKLT